MWKTKNNIPMDEDLAFQKFIEYGYKPLEHYKNNMVKICCLDSEGYKVMISRASLGRVKEYQRFSITSNPNNYIYNLNIFGTRNHYPSIVINHCESKIKNHVNLICRCECGETFICDANSWKRNEKTRCNKCVAKLSNIERKVKMFLDDNNISYVWQKRFDNCKNIKPLPFDFYLQDFNTCIEVDGEQHFYSYDKFNKRMSLEQRKINDNIKTKFCLDNNINLIRLKYNIIRNDKFKEILIDKLNIH